MTSGTAKVHVPLEGKAASAAKRDLPGLVSLGIVAALLVLLAAAGARVSLPPVSAPWPHPGRVAATGGVLELVLAALLVALRWRRPRPAERPADDLAARLRRILHPALVTALIAVPALIALAEAKVLKGRRSRPPPQAVKFRTARPVPPALARASNFSFGPLLFDLAVAVLIAALVAAVLIVWHRRRSRPETAAFPDPGTELTEAELSRAVGSGQAALLEFSDARLAIIRCYLAMESSLANAGTVRGEAETPDELLARAVAADLVPPTPARLLTSLFYEARFSTHPMPPHMRDLASGALGELAAAVPGQPSPRQLAATEPPSPG
jgi:hypothetical protein